MTQEIDSNFDYSLRQIEILKRAGVSRPQDLLDPAQKLEFANSGEAASVEDPFGKYRFFLNPAAMEREGLNPLQRMELQEQVELATRERFERATNRPTGSISDAEHVRVLDSIHPYAYQETATKIDRILPYFKRL